MKIKITGSEEELKAKSFDLVQAIGELLKGIDPNLSDYLSKAIENKDIKFNDPVMREILKRDELAYKKQLELMLQDIDKILNKV